MKELTQDEMAVLSLQFDTEMQAAIKSVSEITKRYRNKGLNASCLNISHRDHIDNPHLKVVGISSSCTGKDMISFLEDLEEHFPNEFAAYLTLRFFKD